MRNKKAQFNFGWIFAILAGGAILFLAIFGAMRAGETAQFQSSTEIAKTISILTDPLQAGFSEGSFGGISFQDETRINNICFSTEFGKNDISVAMRSDIGEEWSLAGGATSIHNKYIFSQERNSGTDYYVFSKPFRFPYKVADLIFLISENYCFTGNSDDYEKIANEIIGLGIPNIEIGNCTAPDAIKVCFGSTTDCDIKVSGTGPTGSKYDKGTVAKGSYDVKYVGNLMYAAIFSDRTNYNCNVKRLLYRTEKIAEELIEKSDIMRARDCSSGMKNDLIAWKSDLNSTAIERISSLNEKAQEMEDKNDRELCGLW